MIQLAITYTAPGHKPHYVCLIDDEDLIKQAARVAVHQATQDVAAESDPILKSLQSEELRRLKASLDLMVPGYWLPTLGEEGRKQ